MHDLPWTALPLTALGIKSGGSPAVILEIATVPLINGRLQPLGAYHSIINPGRFIPPHPSIPQDLENNLLALGPSLADIRPELEARLHGRAIICHDADRTWQLLAEHCPNIKPVALFDTLHLAQAARPDVLRRSLTALLRCYKLAEQAEQLAAGVRPQRALWDAVSVGLLLPTLITAWSQRRTVPIADELADVPSPMAVCP